MDSNRRVTPLFTLVMGLYDVEAHVARAVESVRSQTFGDWELLIVDDGSQDHSVLQALRAAHSDQRIRLVHHDGNEGLSAARNDGVERAHGSYLCFPDAEDVMEPWFLETAAKAIEAHRPDIVVQGVLDDFFSRSGDLRYSTERLPPDAVALDSEAVDALVMPLEEQGLVSYVYPYVFRRGLLGDYRFADDGRKGEDFYLTLALLERADSMVSVGREGYRYCHHFHDRLARIYDPDAFTIRDRKVRRLERFLASHGLASPELEGALGAVYVADVVDALVSLTEHQPDITHGERLEWVGRLMDDRTFHHMVSVAHAPHGGALAAYIRVMRSGKPDLMLALGKSVGYLRSFGPQSWSRAHL